jgi:predicted RNase H-like HicB family nuclease
VRFRITLETTEAGFAVQVPDLAIITFGADVDDAKRAAREAIAINLEAYREAGQTPPSPRPLAQHLENADFTDLLFAYVEAAVPEPQAA